MVFLKDVSGNADAGTAQKWGGNQISLIDNLFDNVDISASIVNGTGKVRMATAWYFRSGKFEIRNPADTFSYIFIGSAIAANRNITIPLLTGNANMVLDSITNTFTAAQVITSSSNGTILELFGTYNTVGNEQALVYRARDSGNNTTTYAQINSQIETNTDGAEDGSLEFKLINDGSVTTRMAINEEGDTEHILEAANSDALWLKRPRNTVGDNVKIHFQHFNSVSAYHSYAQINSEIVTNTDNAEEGRLEFATSTGGALSEAMLIHFNGDVDITRGGLDITRDGNADLLDLERTDNSVGNENGINFLLEDSANNMTQYGRIHTRIFDATNGSEDGDMYIGLIRGGTFRNDLFRFDNGASITMKKYSNTAFDEQGLVFSALDSGSAEQQYGAINIEYMDTVAGSEDGQFDFDLVRGGSVVRVMKLENDGKLRVGRDTSNLRPVNTTLVDSSAEVSQASSTSEVTMVSYTVKGNTIGVDGSHNLIMWGTLTQNQATGTTYTLRIKVAGVTIYQDDFGGTLAQNVNERPWHINITFFPSNQSGSNGRMYGYAMMNDTTGSTTGQGSIADDEQQANAIFKSSSYSWTIANDTTFSVTMQMSVNNAATNWRRDYFIVKQYFS